LLKTLKIERDNLKFFGHDETFSESVSENQFTSLTVNYT